MSSAEEMGGWFRLYPRFGGWTAGKAEEVSSVSSNQPVIAVEAPSALS